MSMPAVAADHVVAAEAVDDVVTGGGADHVVAGRAGQRVVAGGAEHGALVVVGDRHRAGAVERHRRSTGSTTRTENVSSASARRSPRTAIATVLVSAPVGVNVTVAVLAV